ncbi:MAG: acyltransferase [Rhodospirillaceae bacterium]|nr:acyltransferase [Rhodospirillales bacterium]
MSDGVHNPSALSTTLDHLRWVSALAVLLGHAREVLFVPHFPPGALPVWAKALYFLTNFQKEAVIVFFVLSGVLIGGKLMDYAARPAFPLGRYAIERLTRLYVVLLPALALSLLPLLTGACTGSVGAWLASLVFLQDVAAPALSCNEPLWSLANEFWYYVLGALVVLGPRRRLAWLVAAAVMGGLLVLDNAVDGRNVALHAPIWAMGMLAFSPGVPRLRLVPAVLVLAGALVVSRLHLLDPVFWLRDAIIGAAVVLLLNAIAARPTPASPVGWGPVGWGPVRWGPVRWGRGLAGFSYSLYLTHWPVLLLIRQTVLPTPLDPMQPRSYALALAAAAVAFAVAFVFALATERQTARVRRAVMAWGVAAGRLLKV